MTTVPVRPPLVRSSDRIVAGVCAGLAAHLGWPVRMVRIGMTVAALAGGAGLVFYAWLWIMVPTADEAARRNAKRPASPIAPAVSSPAPNTPVSDAAVPPPAVGHPPSDFFSSAVYDDGTSFRPTAPGAVPGTGAPAAAGAPGAAGPRGAVGAAGATGPPGAAGAPAAAGATGGPWFRGRTVRYGKEILLGSGLLLVAG